MNIEKYNKYKKLAESDPKNAYIYQYKMEKYASVPTKMQNISGQNGGAFVGNAPVGNASVGNASVGSTQNGGCGRCGMKNSNTCKCNSVHNTTNIRTSSIFNGSKINELHNMVDQYTQEFDEITKLFGK